MLAKQNPHLDGRVCEREERKVKVMRKFFAHFGIYYIYMLRYIMLQKHVNPQKNVKSSLF